MTEHIVNFFKASANTVRAMSIDSIKLRNALGNFATGVCIVTAGSQLRIPIGMTINSFASVSLEPALVLWSIQHTSECFDIFSSAEYFAINILSSEQQGHSQHYSKKGQHELSSEHCYAGGSGTPLLLDALTTFECRLWARYPGGDHLIIVGEIMESTVNAPEKPLLFYKGAYAKLHY